MTHPRGPRLPWRKRYNWRLVAAAIVVAAFVVGCVVRITIARAAEAPSATTKDCDAGQYKWKGECHRLKHRYIHCGRAGGVE